MSLKGKIEAIIYAAEEPVTLEQLRGLLGEEAAALLAERASRQQPLPLRPGTAETPIPLPSEPDQLNDEVLDYSEFVEDPDEPADTEDNTPGETANTPPAQIGQPSETHAGEPSKPEAGEPSETEGGSTPPAQPVAPVETEAEAEPPTPAAEAAPPPAPERAPAPDEKQLQRAARERERAIRDLLREQLDELIRDYATGDRGLEIREVASGFRLATRPEYHDAVRGFARSLKPPLKLSLQALETLAVVAYKQPVTAPEVSEIRGVDSGGVLGSLMARKLVVPAGRKQVVGRPILYKTTKEFLLRFGLRDVSELPSIEEFEKLAGELADTEPLQEEIPMADEHSSPDDMTVADLREEESAVEPQADGDVSTEALEATPIDGRIAGLTAPTGEPADPSAAEAEIQRDQQAATEGTED